MPFTAAQLVCALLLPAVLAAVLTQVARDVRETSVGCARAGLGGLMMILTIVVAHAATAMAVDARLVPPLLGWHWLPWAAIAIVPLMIWALPRRIVALGSSYPIIPVDTGFQNTWRWCAVGAGAAFGAWLVLRPLPFSELFTPVHMVAGITAAAVLAIVTGMVQSPGDRSPLLDRITATICSGGIAIGVIATGSKDLALLAGIVPMAIIGSGLASLAIDRSSWTGGLVVTAIVTGWHLLIAASYSELPLWIAPVFALALPAALAAGRLGSSPRRRGVWQLGTAVAIVGVALVLVLAWGQPPAPASDGPDYHY